MDLILKLYCTRALMKGLASGQCQLAGALLGDRQEWNYLRRVYKPGVRLRLTMLKDADLRTDLPT